MSTPALPELHEQDPRLCPGRPGYLETVEEFGGAPDWNGPKPFTTSHDFGDAFSPTSYCRWCDVSKDQVRDRFRDWRYETLVQQLTRVLENKL